MVLQHLLVIAFEEDAYSVVHMVAAFVRSLILMIFHVAAEIRWVMDRAHDGPYRLLTVRRRQVLVHQDVLTLSNGSIHVCENARMLLLGVVPVRVLVMMVVNLLLGSFKLCDFQGVVGTITVFRAGRPLHLVPQFAGRLCQLYKLSYHILRCWLFLRI